MIITNEQDKKFWREAERIKVRSYDRRLDVHAIYLIVKRRWIAEKKAIKQMKTVGGGMVYTRLPQEQ